MNVIFLDFNGVLDTYQNPDVVDASNLERLNSLVQETNSSIVISSSIKNSYYYYGKHNQTFLDLVQALKEKEIPILGITECKKTREEEIETFLIKHPEIENYVILDDDYDMRKFGNHMIKLIPQTDPESVGLTDKDVEKALSVFQKPKVKVKK